MPESDWTSLRFKTKSKFQRQGNEREETSISFNSVHLDAFGMKKRKHVGGSECRRIVEGWQEDRTGRQHS